MPKCYPPTDWFLGALNWNSKPWYVSSLRNQQASTRISVRFECKESLFNSFAHSLRYRATAEEWHKSIAAPAAVDSHCVWEFSLSWYPSSSLYINIQETPKWCLLASQIGKACQSMSLRRGHRFRPILGFANTVLQLISVKWINAGMLCGTRALGQNLEILKKPSAKEGKRHSFNPGFLNGLWDYVLQSSSSLSNKPWLSMTSECSP